MDYQNFSLVVWFVFICVPFELQAVVVRNQQAKDNNVYTKGKKCCKNDLLGKDQHQQIEDAQLKGVFSTSHPKD